MSKISELCKCHNSWADEYLCVNCLENGICTYAYMPSSEECKNARCPGEYLGVYNPSIAAQQANNSASLAICQHRDVCEYYKKATLFDDVVKQHQ